jgi:hypothetical protein
MDTQNNMERETIIFQKLTEDVRKLDLNRKTHLRRIESLEEQLSEIRKRNTYIRRDRRRFPTSSSNLEFPLVLSKLIEWFALGILKKDFLLYFLLFLVGMWLLCRTSSW